MISVSKLIEELSLEDPERSIKRVIIFFDNNDRFTAINNRVDRLNKVRDKENKLKEIK